MCRDPYDPTVAGLDNEGQHLTPADFDRRTQTTWLSGHSTAMSLLHPPAPADPTPLVDNADPHPVIVAVHPREWVIPFAHQFEAEYEITVEHPGSCSGASEECPVADYLEVCGGDGDFHAGFPAPDDLSDADLAALDGTIRYVEVTRTLSRWSNADGEGWDADYHFTWGDIDEVDTARANAKQGAALRDAVAMMVFAQSHGEINGHGFEVAMDGDGWNEPFSDHYTCICEGWSIEWTQTDREHTDRTDPADALLAWHTHVEEETAKAMHWLG